jgi:3-hydroxyisobutyrate dehydrogenase
MTPLGAKAAELYRSFVENGEGDSDFSGIINLLRDRSGSGGE